MSNCKNCSPFLSAGDARNAAKKHSLIYAEICKIQSKIMEAIDAKQYSVAITTGTPFTTVADIQAVTVVNGGAGYDLLNASASVTQIGGVGADIVPVVTNGVVTSFVINNGGTGYQDIYPTVDASMYGSGTAEIVPVTVDGVINSVQILVMGNGYTVGQVLPVIHPLGYGAILQVHTVGLSGQITSVKVVSGGASYNTLKPVVTINHPTGIGFSGNVITAAGVITGVSIVNGGLGYSPVLPYFDISGVGDGAELVPVLDAGVVTSVTVIKGGYNYQSTDVATLVPVNGGTGATFTLTVNPNSYPGADPIRINNVFIGQITDPAITDQLDTVKKYFECLGYAITIKTNPVTMNTIMWDIRW